MIKKGIKEYKQNKKHNVTPTRLIVIGPRSSLLSCNMILPAVVVLAIVSSGSVSILL